MTKTEAFQNVVTGLLALCALAVAGTVVHREFFARAPPTGQGTTRPPVQKWAEYAVEGHRIGPAAARVVIVEFSDFQCPYCRRTAARLDTLRAEFPVDVALVYRHFPLNIHEHAVAAARASECAAEQGRFWQMHDALYKGQDSIGAVGWDRFASDARLPDPSSFRRCFAHSSAPRVARDTVAAKRLGVRSTPTMLINETWVEGSVPLDSLRALVRRKIAD